MVVKIGTGAPEPGFWAFQPDSPRAISVGPAGPGHGLPVVIAAESPCWGSDCLVVESGAPSCLCAFKKINKKESDFYRPSAASVMVHYC